VALYELPEPVEGLYLFLGVPLWVRDPGGLEELEIAGQALLQAASAQEGGLDIDAPHPNVEARLTQ
jgi:hypothetical protein